MIARILHSRGRYLEAAEVGRQILELRQKEARLGHLTAVAEAAAAYGQSLLRLGRYSEAEDVLRNALDSYDCPYDGAEGDRHVDTLDCKENLAETLFAQGSHEEAVKLGREVLEGRTRSLGLLHVEVINGMSNLATYLCRANQSEESRGLLHNAMGMSAVYLGRENYTTLSVWSNGATIHRLLGDLDIARALAYHSFRMSERVKTIHHPDTLFAMTEFCWALGQDGRFSSARDHIAVCIRYTGRFYGWSHPLVLRRASDLCDLVAEAFVGKDTKRPSAVRAFFKGAVGYRRAQRLTLVHQRRAGTPPTGESQPFKLGQTVFYI
jgi:tetratricopeptide (TPR) repeat protein